MLELAPNEHKIFNAHNEDLKDRKASHCFEYNEEIGWTVVFVLTSGSEAG